MFARCVFDRGLKSFGERGDRGEVTGRARRMSNHMLAQRPTDLFRKDWRHGVSDLPVLVRPLACENPVCGKGLQCRAFTRRKAAKAVDRIAYPVLLSIGGHRPGGPVQIGDEGPCL